MSPLLLLIPILCFVLPCLILMKSVAERNKMKKLNTPPGSMGLPFVGETFKFIKPYPSTSIGEFMDHKIKRHGKIFKTKLMGKPTIVSADIEFNQFVLENDGRLFDRDLPKIFYKKFETGFIRLTGTTYNETSMGRIHLQLKNKIFGYFLGVPRLMSHFLHHYENYTLEVLSSWKEDVPFSAHLETDKVTFYMIAKSVLSLNPGEKKAEELRRLYHTFAKGFMSLPIDLPWTNLGKALKAKRAILGIIERTKEERIKAEEERRDVIGDSDYFGILLDRMSHLTNEQIAVEMLMMLLGGHETSSAGLALAIYFLAGCKKAVQQLQEEHREISRRKKERGETQITWNDYKLMEFTQCVITESLRLGNVTQQVNRKALTDVKFKGYDIPKGWGVIPTFSATHLDGDVYKDPQRFNPWRWQRTSVTKEMIDNYMPFSQGFHKCTGMEFTKMEIAIFLHHLVLRYEWGLVATEQPIRQPGFLVFSNGLLIKVRAL